MIKFINLLMTQSSSWLSKHGCRYFVCDVFMIYYGNIAKKVYFGNGGTNQRFHNIATSPIILDFCYVFLRGGGLSKVHAIK